MEIEQLKSDIGRRMEGALEVLQKEFAGLRTGRASISLLEPLTVEAYGQSMPMDQVGTIGVPEARLLTIQVWDKGLVSSVEKAIRDSNLGLNPILPQKRLASSRLEMDQAIAAANNKATQAKKACFSINAVRDKNRSANAATCKTRRRLSPDIFKSSAPAVTAKSATLHLKYGSPYQVTARKTGAKTNVDSRRISMNTNDRTITVPKRRSVGLADQTQTRLEKNALS